MINQTISHFKITKKLGEGGMGVVYKAGDTKLRRTVAIKFLPRSIAVREQEKERFKIEARAAAVLNHPNIATIYAIEEAHDELFIVMEFIDGQALDKVLQKKFPRGLKVREAIYYADQIANGLQTAHEKRIIHRDIKSANIMLTDKGRIKILDFGLAKVSGERLLLYPGSVLGTPAYMSPEQIQGKPVDRRTDIWSFGVVLYEMLTGTLPFHGDYEAELLYLILNENPKSPREIRPDIPDQLVSIVHKALEKDPENRYESMQNVIFDLNGTFNVESGSIAIHNRTDSFPKPAAAIRKSHLTSEDERRQVSVVVSTLSGYEELVERLQPEEVSHILKNIRNMVVEIANRHKGLVNQLNEDKIILLFGTPIIHEDDPSRAVRSALELHDSIRKLSEELAGRIDQKIHLYSGIDTGLMIVQSRNEEDCRFKITGAPLQIASRLAAEAHSDEILISSTTQRSVDPFFDTEAGEPFTIQQMSQPVMPFVVKRESGSRSRLEAIERIQLTPFVGRDSELNLLKTGLDDTINGNGQFVTVIGEAGMGKSRLLYEFRNQVSREVKITSGRCQSHGGNIPYLPFIELLQELLEVDPGDSGEDHIENVVSRILEIDSNLDDYVPVFLQILSMRSSKYPLPPYVRSDNIQQLIAEGIVAIFTLAANSLPLVILLEDWHWVDQASYNILRQLAAVISNFPLYIILTYRPEVAFEWGHPATYTRIQLAPLESSDSIAIVKSVLEAERVPEELTALLHERTGGNPFFVEEMSQTLREEMAIKIEERKVILTDPASKIHLPQTIQAVIRSRLDRLDPDSLELLHIASVIGREFTQAILENVAPAEIQLREPLKTLQNFGLIQPIRAMSRAAYRFKHILTQEVAYDSLLQHQRKVLHGKVGEAIEKVYSGRLQDQANLLMEHFGHAENWRKAVLYGRETADNATHLGHYSIVLNIVERVEAWTSKLETNQAQEEILINVLLQKERACEGLGYLERQKEIIDRLLTLIGSEDIKRAEVYIRLGDVLNLSNRFKDAENAYAKALELCKKLDSEDTELSAWRSLGFLKWRTGNDEEADLILKKVIELDIRKGEATVLAQDLFSHFNVLSRLGDFARAKKCVDDALALYEQVSPRQRNYLMLMAGHYYRDIGDYKKAIEFLEKSNRILKKFPGARPGFALSSIANIHLQQGNVEEALRYYQEALTRTRKLDSAADLSLALWAAGCALLSLERNIEAVPYLQEAAEVFRQLQDSENEILALNMIASAFEKDGKHDSAYAAWEQARAKSREADNMKGELTALKGMARAMRKLGHDPSRTLQYYHRALDLAGQLENLHEQGDILNSMGIIEWQSNHFERALSYYEKALDIFCGTNDRIHTGLILNSIAATLKKLRRHQEALTHLQEALRLHRQADQPLLQGHALALRGDIYFELQELDRAQKNYRHALKLRQKISDRKGEGRMYLQLAKVFKMQDSTGKSLKYAEKALAIAKECSDVALENEVHVCLSNHSRDALQN